MTDQNPFFKIDAAGLEFLRAQWVDLTLHCGADRVDVEEWFDRLVQSYGASDRAYHNLGHIRSLLSLGDSFKGSVRHYDALRFAIWFHDAVYDSRRKDNEDLSAEMAGESLLILKVPLATAEQVREMILATKDHKPRGGGKDQELFLDFDLAILGSADPIYQNYAKAIRSEYQWVPDFAYRQERKKVLESFLARDSLYYTEEMIQKYERQARWNVEREIKFLSD